MRLDKLHHVAWEVAGHLGGGSKDDAEVGRASYSEAVVAGAEEPSGWRSGGIEGQAKAVVFGRADHVCTGSIVDDDDRFPEGVGGEGGAGRGVSSEDNVGTVAMGEDANGGGVPFGEDEGSAVFIGSLVLGENTALSGHRCL